MSGVATSLPAACGTRTVLRSELYYGIYRRFLPFCKSFRMRRLSPVLENRTCDVATINYVHDGSILTETAGSANLLHSVARFGVTPLQQLLVIAITADCMASGLQHKCLVALRNDMKPRSYPCETLSSFSTLHKFSSLSAQQM